MARSDPARDGALKGEPVALPFRDGLRVDPEPILRLHTCLGDEDAAAYLRQARQEMNELMAVIDLHFQSGAFHRLPVRSHRIGALALQLGFREIVEAAHNVCACAEIGDSTDTAATVARLLRLGALAVEEMAGMQRAMV